MDNYARLADLDFDHPFCEGRSNLDVADQYFVEIENEFPGKNDYNAMIRLYQKQNWSALAQQIEIFRGVYESTPLLEAVAYLEVQALFDQLEYDEPEPVKVAERKLRETLLLYPKSQLAPVVTANIAAFYLRAGNYAKSLALFSAGKQEYPFHKLNCTFQFGSAESNYLVHDFDAARTGFKQVIQKCETLRSKVGAEARLLDIERETSGVSSSLDAKYDQLYKRSGVTLSRFFPHFLANMGELKYRRAQYPSAKFFLNEYTRYGSKDFAGCLPVTLNRLADTAFRSKETMPDSVAKYLLVRDRYPRNDWGRFSYIRALLLEMRTVPEAEKERRLKVIDTEAEAIKLMDLQNRAYLEKGLAMLDAGKKEALEYLIRIDDQTAVDLKKGEIGAFVRDRLLKILESEVKGVYGRNDKARDRLVFEPLEASYSAWLKGTSFEKPAKELYQEMVLDRFLDSLALNMGPAIQKLARWKKSELWPGKVSESVKNKVATAITKKFMALPEKEVAKAASVLLENEDTLRNFLSPAYQGLWTAARLAIDDKEGVARALKASPKRGIASVGSAAPKELASYLALTQAKGARLSQLFTEADRYLDQVKDAHFQMDVLRERFLLYQEAGWQKKLLSFGYGNLGKLEREDRKPYLQDMRIALQNGKLWKDADHLMKQVTAAGIEGEALAPFLATHGRAQAELSDCKGAVDSFEAALKASSSLDDKTQVQFRLGKCYLRTRKKEKAIEVWKAAVEAKDPLWSELAANELKLTESP